MENESKKPRIQVRLGGLVILIILALILFKVDIRSKIESEQFQKNISYVTEKTQELWKQYVSDPLKSKTGELVKDLADKGLNQIQKSVDEKANSLFDTRNFKNSFKMESTSEEE